MEYSTFYAEKFALLKYNVFSVPSDESILRSMPELQRFETFVQNENRPDINNIIRFIVAMYDKRSPFIKMFQDVDKRKLECAAFAGYNIEADKALLDCMFSFSNPLPRLVPVEEFEGQEDDDDLEEEEDQINVTFFSEMVIEFLKDQNSRVWSMIVSNEQSFYEYQKALMSEVTQFTTQKDKLGAISIKSKLMEDSDIISERLEKYYQQLFGTGELAEQANINYTPEGMARVKK